MIICKNCNFQFENTEFCPNCGTPISTVSEQPIVEEVVSTPEVVKSETVVEESVESTDTIVIADEKPAEDPGASMGKISFILGLIALISGAVCSCGFACLGGSLPFICAVVSVVLSVMASNKSKAAGFVNKKATTGLILSIVAVIVIIIFVIFNGILGAAMSPFLEEIMYELF